MSASRPEDLLLDRYFPDADEKTRETARADFRRFVTTLFAIAIEVAERESLERDSPNLDRRRRIRPVP